MINDEATLPGKVIDIPETTLGLFSDSGLWYYSVTQSRINWDIQLIYYLKLVFILDYLTHISGFSWWTINLSQPFLPRVSDLFCRYFSTDNFTMLSLDQEDLLVASVRTVSGWIVNDIRVKTADGTQFPTLNTKYTPTVNTALGDKYYLVIITYFKLKILVNSLWSAELVWSTSNVSW